MDRETTTVVLADDQPLYLEAMGRTLRADDRFDVVAAVSDGAACIDAHDLHRPTLTVVAVELDDIGGLEVLRRIRRTHPRARVCMTATRAHAHEVLSAAQVGACGFLDKHVVDSAELHRQLTIAAEGGDAYDARSLTAMMRALRTVDRYPDATIELTGRQMDVLRHIAAGRSNAQIADAMDVSINTVKTYVRNVYVKLAASDRAEAVARAYEMGLVRHRRAS